MILVVLINAEAMQGFHFHSKGLWLTNIVCYENCTSDGMIKHWSY